jgi:hypothetical protein
MRPNFVTHTQGSLVLCGTSIMYPAGGPDSTPNRARPGRGRDNPHNDSASPSGFPTPNRSSAER